jgi:hypothetical protein
MLLVITQEAEGKVMSIILNNTITRENIIAKFNERVRDWVVSNTNFLNATPVWNQTVGYITANSSAFGGGINRITEVSATPVSIQVTDLISNIGADNSAAGKIVKVLKDFLILYANNHRITLNNTGNLAPANYVGVARLNGTPLATQTAIGTDVDAAAIASNVSNGQLITALNLNSFIESCRTIWTNRAFTPSLETFNYSYCHSSCHSNVTCYNSRGRR